MADIGTPTPLSEIANIHGDADDFAGANGVSAAILPESDTAKYIANWAAQKDATNKFLAEQHEKRINDVMANANGIDMKDVMANDLPDITSQYAGLMGDIANNYDAIADPASNVQAWGNYQQKLANLQGQIALSKSHNAIYQENQKMLASHPEYNTDENQAMMNNYANTPMSKRRNFILKTPLSYDPTVFGKAAAANVGEKVDKDTLSKGGTYIVNSKGEYYDPNKFIADFNALHQTTTINGAPAINQVQAIYNRSVANGTVEKNPDGTPITFDQFQSKNALANLPANFKAVTIKPNEAQIAANRLSFDYWKAKLDNSVDVARLAMQGDALKANQIKPEEGAEAAALVRYNAFKGKGVPYEIGQNMWGSDPSTDVKFSTGGGYVKGDDGQYHQAPTVEQKVPSKQFVSSTPDGHGNVINTFNVNQIDTQTGKLDTKTIQEKVSYDQSGSDVARIYGNKPAPQVASGITLFNRNKIKSTNPTLDDLDNYFNQTPKGQKPAGKGMSDDAYQKFLDRLK